VRGTFLFGALTMLVCGATLDSASAAERAEERDVFDRPIAAQLAGRPRLVLYANRNTSEETSEPASRMAVRLRDIGYVTVVRVDLRGIPSFFEGIARNAIQKAHVNSTRRSLSLYGELGIEPPPDIASRLIFVSDSHGESHAALGLEKGFVQAMAIVEDGAGREVLRGRFPEDLERFEQVLGSLVR
jgi:hypothetical protein